MRQIILKPKEHLRVVRGHSWVFSNEIAERPTASEPGELVEVFSSNREYLGSAFYHPHALIAARMLGQRINCVDEAFLKDRIAAALELRQRCLPGETCYRLIHGESDALPGLIVDRFGDYLSIQTLTAGMDRITGLILAVLGDLFQPTAIIERNDTHLRDHEGLERRKGVLKGRIEGPVEILEHGLTYTVDLLEGQKTGFFLDQKMNRQAVARYSPGSKVLDCFCNVGGFSLNAARAGAASVVGVDSSEGSVRLARANALKNHLSSVRFVNRDVFEHLSLEVKSHARYDLIILDPPSFAPRKKDVGAARKAYRHLNEFALLLLGRGGILVTASCSYHLYEEVFYRVVQEAAMRTGRELQLLEQRQQSPDHPVLPAMPETRYLKLGIFRVLSEGLERFRKTSLT